MLYVFVCVFVCYVMMFALYNQRLSHYSSFVENRSFYSKFHIPKEKGVINALYIPPLGAIKMNYFECC